MSFIMEIYDLSRKSIGPIPKQKNAKSSNI